VVAGQPVTAATAPLFAERPVDSHGHGRAAGGVRACDGGFKPCSRTPRIGPLQLTFAAALLAAMSVRRRIHALFEPSAERGSAARVLDLALSTLIVANIAAVVLETVPGFGERHRLFFARFEAVSLAVFAVEYLLRLWSCTADPRHAAPVSGRLRFALRPLALVDLLAILPGLLLWTSADLRVLRSLRLVRLLKLTRHSNSLQTFGRILRSKAPELGSTLFVMLLLLVVASSLMFFLERDANPAFDSIPSAMWWGIATFTTVGYGDITPITPAGRLLGGVVAILGIAMFAIPAGVLGAAFSAELDRRAAARPGHHAASPPGAEATGGAPPADAPGGADPR